jgi:ABC-type multidrug transport system ATPase subunit
VCDRIVIVHAGRVVADEALARLLDLFRPRGYRVEVEGAVSEGQEARLRARFGALGITRGETTSTLELESEAGTFYSLIEALRGSGLEVHSMERRSRSLEEIYLSLTGGP